MHAPRRVASGGDPTTGGLPSLDLDGRLNDSAPRAVVLALDRGRGPLLLRGAIIGH